MKNNYHEILKIFYDWGEIILNLAPYENSIFILSRNFQGRNFSEIT